MTVAERAIHVWTCDSCGRTVNAWAETDEQPRSWLVFDAFAPDSQGGAKHFHEPRCLAKWLNEQPITVAGIGDFTLADVVGWTGSDHLPERVLGCRSCGTRSGEHKVGCSLHR